MSRNAGPPVVFGTPRTPLHYSRKIRAGAPAAGRRGTGGGLTIGRRAPFESAVARVLRRRGSLRGAAKKLSHPPSALSEKSATFKACSPPSRNTRYTSSRLRE
ncbi:hypothetical protein SKAU_G00257400 [Synaphobranchus kaupii]|uniref:Uncharacterized protein n=1 Tax=Synaphobranchus kaupii TaxID=118154 RepID=A0A9Q1F425_SYNKA|nr:hypothetical protein SKAU_G00257400 [Synaphobranchus kaupii]